MGTWTRRPAPCISVFSGEVIGDDGDPADLDEHDWIAIEPEGSREPYEDMVEFAEQVTDPGLRRSLDRALEGKGRLPPVPHRDVRGCAGGDVARLELLPERPVGAARPAAGWRTRTSWRLRSWRERIRIVEEASVLGPLPTAVAPGTGTKVDLAEKLSLFSEHWSPKVVARLNDYEIKLVKVKGEFVWHTHDDTDELFLVIDGHLTIQLRDGDVSLASRSALRRPARRRALPDRGRRGRGDADRARGCGQHR